MSNEIVVVNNVRYRHDDARRLGLLADGKVVTAKSVQRNRTTKAPAGLITSEARNPGSTDASKPAKNAAKSNWTAYALANGKTEEELDGLTRDDIAGLFPDFEPEVEGDKSTTEGDKSTTEGDKSTTGDQ